MVRSFLFSIAAAALALSAPLAVYVAAPREVVAQEATAAPAASDLPVAPAAETSAPPVETTITPLPSASRANLVNDCFAVYPFGKLSMVISEPAAGASVSPGDVMPIAGTIYNNSHAVLPEGRVYVRILREDVAVAPQHWHPVVAEFLIDHLSVPPYRGTAGEATFSSSWHVPAFAPPGAYRVEVSYLGADNSPILGVQHVPNVFGAAQSYTISEAGSAAAVAFQRGQVLFNGTPFVFRAVPPRPEAGPLTIVAPLAAGGAHDISVNVEKSLYSWTDVEGDTLISSETEPFLISPAGESAPVSFTWEAPQPGVYELVLKAVPTNENILPSILHVRFYYEGTVPRILHTGMRTEEDGSGTVAACFFNSTFGPEGGSGTFKIESDGTTVQEVTLADLTAEKVSLLPVSVDIVKAGFVLVAEAKDLMGKVTDSERVTFPAEHPEEESISSAEFKLPNLPDIPVRWYWVGGGLLAVLLFSIFSYVRRHRMYTEPKEQSGSM